MGAQAVFVVVVCCHSLGAEGGVAIALPTAAEVDGLIDAAEAVGAADGDAHGIVFAIAHVGEPYLTDDGSVEGTWCTQAVDAQGVVHAILLGPLAVVDDAWRQGLQGEVAQAVATHDHGAALAAEGVDDALQRVWVAVEVVAIELYGIAPALLVTYGEVPAATNAKIATLGRYNGQLTIGNGQLRKDLCCAVSGVVVHNDEVEGEVGHLR